MHKSFQLLPLGAVRPTGWLGNQLAIQAGGLSGHLDEFWDDVSDKSQWLGGDREGWERGPYYVDGLLPLAYLLDDPTLQAKTQKWVEAFLTSQDDTGWIGPVKGSGKGRFAYDPWPLFIVMKVLTQYYEVSEDQRVLTVMTRFFAFLREHLPENPLQSWGKFRWADLVVSIHWLYSHTSDEWLLELAELVFEQGYDWQNHFVDFRYKKKQPVQMETHVVNNAMGLKTPAVWFSQTGDERYRQGVYQALENLDRFHGQANGAFSGDEHLSGKNPSQGTELCAIVEMMYSLEHIAAILGDVAVADRLEQLAYNALPATFSPDMWAHQYDQQVNQVICNVAERDWSNEPDANIYGLEPNFGCCTANMHQGWPKFVSSLWMSAPDGGLAAICYAPNVVEVSLSGGKAFTIRENTNYPFDEAVTLTVEVAEPVAVPLYLRIPQWAVGASIKLPDGSVQAGQSGTFVRIERIWENGDQIVLEFPMNVTMERRFNGAVTLRRGPLVFALPVDEEWKQIGGELPHADWEVYPTSPWNYGLIVERQHQDLGWKVEKLPVGNCPFSPAQAPIKLVGTGRIVPEWTLEGYSAGPVPLSPVRSSERTEPLTLVPYGCTNLRVTELPLIEENS